MNRLRPLGAVKGLAEPPHRAELRVALLHQLVAVQGGWGQASGLGSGFVSFTRARPPTAGAGAHEGTKARRDEGGEALGCTPCEAAHPPPARGAHEGTKARRDGDTKRRRRGLDWGQASGLGSGFVSFTRARPSTAGAGAHEGTKARRDGGRRLPPALLSPREPAQPPPARGAHEGTKARRDGGADRIGVRLRFFHESPPTHRRRGAHTKARTQTSGSQTSGSGLETSGVEARCLASRGQGGVDRRDRKTSGSKDLGVRP